jgi:hypothetical protein
VPPFFRSNSIDWSAERVVARQRSGLVEAILGVFLVVQDKATTSSARKMRGYCKTMVIPAEPRVTAKPSCAPTNSRMTPFAF